MFFFGGGAGVNIFMSSSLQFEILIIRNKTSCLKDFELTIFDCMFLVCLKIVSEYDHEIIPQSQTSDKPMVPRGRASQQL